MPSLPRLIEPLFTRAGWQPSRADRIDSQDGSVLGLAEEIVRTFRGLLVGETEPGTGTAASNVHFYARLRPEVAKVLSPWGRQVGEIAAFGNAHNDHMILFVGARSQFYVFTDPDEKLYDGGKDFGDLMRRLLFGHDIGPEVVRDDLGGA